MAGFFGRIFGTSNKSQNLKEVLTEYNNKVNLFTKMDKATQSLAGELKKPNKSNSKKFEELNILKAKMEACNVEATKIKSGIESSLKSNEKTVWQEKVEIQDKEIKEKLKNLKGTLKEMDKLSTKFEKLFTKSFPQFKSHLTDFSSELEKNKSNIKPKDGKIIIKNGKIIDGKNNLDQNKSVDTEKLMGEFKEEITGVLDRENINHTTEIVGNSVEIKVEDTADNFLKAAELMADKYGISKVNLEPKSLQENFAKYYTEQNPEIKANLGGELKQELQKSFGQDTPKTEQQLESINLKANNRKEGDKTWREKLDQKRTEEAALSAEARTFTK